MRAVNDGRCMQLALIAAVWVSVLLLVLNTSRASPQQGHVRPQLLHSFRGSVYGMLTVKQDTQSLRLHRHA